MTTAELTLIDSNQKAQYSDVDVAPVYDLFDHNLK